MENRALVVFNTLLRCGSLRRSEAAKRRACSTSPPFAFTQGRPDLGISRHGPQKIIINARGFLPLATWISQGRRKTIQKNAVKTIQMGTAAFCAKKSITKEKRKARVEQEEGTQVIFIFGSSELRVGPS
jgi:hypothetical protein